MDSLSAGSYVWKMSTLWHAVMHPTAYGAAQEFAPMCQLVCLLVTLPTPELHVASNPTVKHRPFWCDWLQDSVLPLAQNKAAKREL
jgi:hypothetical protein